MNKWLRIGLLVFFSATFILSAVMIGSYYWQSDKAKSQFDELADLVSTTTPDGKPIARPEPGGQIGSSQSQNTAAPEPEGEIGTSDSLEASQPLPQYIEVSKRNSHMVGWVQIEGTRINYPVMQTPDSPDYYLKRDFYKNYSGYGCIYAREQCDVNMPSDNVTIYGHNMKDGSMFADLLKYRSKSFWESHRYVYFDTLTRYGTYEIFAVFTTTASKGKGFLYNQFVDAVNEDAYDEYVADCKKLSLYDTGITPEYGEDLITLSTCEYTQTNGRFVVVARRVL